jgi:hypothetical protein
MTSYMRGHPIYFDGERWRYVDTGEETDDTRPCARCGRVPLPDGEDACLGHIPGMASACCGHGVTEPYAIRRPVIEGCWENDRVVKG